jgi:CDP-glycerol glycerophosphotransferase (TagB/SpsB family)
MKPVCSPITSPTFLNDNWTFANIYNHYFCFCSGKDCYLRKKLESTQIFKYKFFLSIIDNNRYVYNKTHYILGDFLSSFFTYDDAYPVFKEMLKRNMSVHYLTQRREIFMEYCKYNSLCQVIIKDIRMNGDFLEKYLELILKLKAIIAGSDLLTMDYMFYNIEYITAINLGHGVKYFKSFLYKDYTSPRKYNKMILVPSRKIINVALQYGWKEENIIKICLPKWDKYDKYKKENKEINKSIFIFLTWRNLKKGKTISNDYTNNMFKLLNNDILIQKLIEKNITLYHRLPPNINDKSYKIKISNPKVKYIELLEISDTLMKSNLLISDFSSVIFDFVYQRKPIIIYIPDSEDPNIKEKYDDDYYNLVNSMKNGTIQFENKFNTTEEVINKIIYYIDNNFELESNIKEFYDSFELKCGNNTNSFINYIENLE